MTADVSFQAAAATPAPAGGVPQEAAPASQGEVVLEIGGRKYTRSDLEKKVVHADTHIARLEAEGEANRRALALAEAALQKAVSVQEVIKAAATPQPDPAAAPQQQPQPAAAAAPKPATVDDVLAALDAKAQAQARDANWAEVTKTLTRLHGDATDRRVTEVAQENGLSKAEAVELAKSKPQLFLKLFPEASKAGPKGPSTFNTHVNPHALSQDRPRQPSGYGKAHQTKDRIAAYSRRLLELAGDTN